MGFRKTLFRAAAIAILTTSAVVASSSGSAVHATLTFVNKTTADGLGDDYVNDVFVAGQTVYAATNGGLSISTDGGQSFVNRTTAQGLGSNQVNAVAVVGSTVYAATQGGLSVSTDGGATFTNNDFGGGMDKFAYDVEVNQSLLAVGTFTGLRVSNDGGQTFALKGLADGLGGGSNSWVQVVTVHLDLFNVYAAIPLGAGIFRSTDGGNTFTAATYNPSQGDMTGVTQDLVNPQVFYARDSNYFYKSTDGGAVFDRQTLNAPGVNFLGGGIGPVWASGPEVMIPTIGGGLLRSEDGGASFSTIKIADGLGSDNVNVVKVFGGGVYVGTSGGLSFSLPPAPTVTVVNPTSGSTAGGTAITITGTNFVSGSTVTVGGAACTNVVVVIATEITCTTPAGSSGTASVVVTSGGLSNAANTLFTYNAPPPPPPVVTTPPTTVPPTTLPPGVPALVTVDNQPLLTQNPGGAVAIVNGQPVSVDVDAPADLPAARVDPEKRSPQQIQQLQQAADSIVDALGDTNSPIGVQPTATGAVITGLLPQNVPVEDVVLVKTPETATVFAALNGDGSVTEVNPGGVIQILGDGLVGVVGTGLKPGDTVELVIMSTPQLLGRFEVNAKGEIKAQASLPDALGVGNHTLVVASPTVKASLGLKVASTRPTLPVTGGGTEPLGPMTVLLSLGAILVVVSRRRTRLVP